MAKTNNQTQINGSVSDEVLVQRLASLSDEALKAILKDESILQRIRNLRSVPGGTDKDIKIADGTEGYRCARCNKKVQAKWKYIQIDGLILNHECAKVYKEDISKGLYKPGDGKACADAFKAHMRNININNPWW